MKNMIQKGENLTLPAPADVVSGELVIVNAIFGIAAENASAGEKMDLATGGVWELPKANGFSINLGEQVFYDPTTKLLKGNGSIRIGVAVAEADEAAGTAAVRLNGSF